jgi:arginyl-tRNA synthetase
MKHLGHGFLRLSSGKMSSRAGNVITGESLIADLEKKVAEKMRDREMAAPQKKETIEKVALAAIRYSILRQSVGKDIVFDADTSISFDGDSGPYLQYAYVRAKSVLRKAAEEKIKASVTVPRPDKSKNNADGKNAEEITRLERLLYRFPEIVERAAADFAPSHIATFLIEVAGEFNSWYAVGKIVDKEDPQSPYKIAITEATSWVIKNGLHLLGIDTPEKM